MPHVSLTSNLGTLKLVSFCGSEEGGENGGQGGSANGSGAGGSGAGAGSGSGSGSGAGSGRGSGEKRTTNEAEFLFGFPLVAQVGGRAKVIVNLPTGSVTGGKFVAQLDVQGGEDVPEGFELIAKSADGKLFPVKSTGYAGGFETTNN